MFRRIINLPETNSFFLFGARGCGKTTLLEKSCPSERTAYIDLLLAAEEDRYRRDPDSLIRYVESLAPAIDTVVIDEIQKVPKLLDIVHHLIERLHKKHRFVLTGSSARKLRHGGANLLAGRLFTRDLFPLTHSELGKDFDVQETLRWGSLPGLFRLGTEAERREFLASYAHTYLKEEIQAEQLVRKVDPFRRFLEVAAQCSGKLVSLSNIARDTGVDGKTIKSFYEILNDTLVGFSLEPFHTSLRKRLRTAPKFYFFDLGVTRALARQLVLEPHPSTSYYGDLFEQLVVLETYRQEQYLRRDYRLSFMRTQDGAEIDLVIERPGKPLALIEIKSTKEVRREALRGLQGFSASFPDAECFLLSQDPRPQKYGEIRALPWREGLAGI